ncbi:MAG: UDP-3-O-(3-hydroxymyristoyl)glucosamine N-acyltransferase [Acidobacteriaceae bacterium]
MKLSEIARRLEVELSHGPDLEITGIAGLQEAQAGHITFLSNPKYAPLLKTTRASAVIQKKENPAAGYAVLRSDNPYLTFARAIDLFYQPPSQAAGIHPTAVVHPTARIGARASIGPYVVIGENAVVGDGCTLHPHVVIYPYAHIGHRLTAHAHAIIREYCIVGNDVVLQNGAVIGCDGFGFARDEVHPRSIAWHKITQSGPAVLEDHVEVQANACIDRATIGETRIRRGAKIDNLSQVGHGCDVGEDSLLCAQVGLAGSTKIGKQVILAGQVGVAGHCTVGDGAIVTAQAGTVDVEAGKIVSGSPAFDNRQWLRSVALFNRLPEIIRELRAAVRSQRQAATPE